MLERGLVSRILFPAPPPSYDVDSFPQDLIWVPKNAGAIERNDDPTSCPAVEDCIPCLLLTYPSARFLIIFFHSNAEDLGRCHGFCCYIRDQFQVHVMAVEYPGYGICPGVPSGESVTENAIAAMNFVVDVIQWPMDSIKVFGRSIGTGPAIALASAFSLAGLILVTPFLSVQELFRDRVGPLASLVDEWFPNSDSAPKITSPTMIIHGQRDELISCRHGESIYELLRPRKLLISPPEMEHNTNLLTNLQFFVLPMFQFFALPDYAFQDLQVPAWAFDKRRSPFYVRPGVEISSHQLPTISGKKKLTIPAGDDVVPAAIDSPSRRPPGKDAEAPLSLNDKLKKGSAKALNGEVITPLKKTGSSEGRKLEPMFSTKDSKKASNASTPMKNLGPVNEDEFPASQPTPMTGPMLVPLSPMSPATEAADNSKVAQEKPLSSLKAQRLFGHKDGRGASHGTNKTPHPPKLIGLEELRNSANADSSTSSKDEQKRQSKSSVSSDELNLLQELQVLEERSASHREQDTDQPKQQQQMLTPPESDLPPSSSSSSSMWPSWCGKPHNMDRAEVNMHPILSPPPPGLPQNDEVDVDLPCDIEPLRRSRELGNAPKKGNADLGWLPADDGPTAASAKLRGTSGGLRNPLLDACCSASPADINIDRAPTMPRPGASVNDDEPVLPFGGRIIAGSHQPESPREDKHDEQLMRLHCLGTPPRQVKKDGVPVPLLTSGFQRGTKFAI